MTIDIYRKMLAVLAYSEDLVKKLQGLDKLTDNQLEILGNYTYLKEALKAVLGKKDYGK